jgi:hypothetical protein
MAYRRTPLRGVDPRRRRAAVGLLASRQLGSLVRPRMPDAGSTDAMPQSQSPSIKQLPNLARHCVAFSADRQRDVALGGEWLSVGNESRPNISRPPTTVSRAARRGRVTRTRCQGPSSFRTTLPARLRGICSTIVISRGCSNRDTLSFRNFRIDSSSMSASASGTTNAASRWP